ncbi:MAG: hypothetical protein JRJ29_00490 [Deltaproteobacteria bacterium]|nr:hypothetical protein [Deltaproteobacteria bacterium]MBW2081646.1 hypothetical protein [Deltaproteobacteria bacterium]
MSGKKDQKEEIIFHDEEDVTEENLAKLEALEKGETDENEDVTPASGKPEEEEGESDDAGEPEGDEPDDTSEDDDKTPGPIPYPRFKEVIDENRDLKAEVTALKAKYETLERMLQVTSQGPPQEEEDETSEQPVTRQDMQQALEQIKDPAVLSEYFVRMQHPDYDELVEKYVAPMVQQIPWLDGYFRSQTVPAKAAYDLACAIRDGKQFSIGIVDGKPQLVVQEETPQKEKPKQNLQPVKDKKAGPDPEALKKSQEQPKTLDDVPAASLDNLEMTPEQWAELPTTTQMRIMKERPEFARKMNRLLNEKYG